MGDISTIILCACMHAAHKQLDRSPSIRLPLSQEPHQVDVDVLCLWDAGSPGDQHFLPFYNPCPNTPATFLPFFFRLLRLDWGVNNNSKLYLSFAVPLCSSLTGNHWETYSTVRFNLTLLHQKQREFKSSVSFTLWLTLRVQIQLWEYYWETKCMRLHAGGVCLSVRPSSPNEPASAWTYPTRTSWTDNFE